MSNPNSSRPGRGWSLLAAVVAGINFGLFFILGLAMLVTIGMAIFLAPGLLPGFLVSWLASRKALGIPGLEEPHRRLARFTRIASLAGLALSGFISLCAAFIVLVVKLGR